MSFTRRRARPPAAAPVVAAADTPAAPPVGAAVGARTAAAGFAYESSRGDGLPDFTMTPVQVEIDRYVDAIGWAGFYVQIKAMLGALCPWIVERREGSEWVRETDPRIQAIAQLIQPPSRSQAGMRFRSLSLQASIAEHAFWPAHTAERGLVFEIAHPQQMRRAQTSQEFFAVATREDARPGGPGWHEYEISRLRRHWVPDRKWPDQAYPELEGVLTELRLYESTVLDLLRSSQSRMLMNGLLWIPTEPPSGNGSDGDGAWVNTAAAMAADGGEDATPDTPAGGGLKDLIADFSAFGARAFRDHRGMDVASRLPYPFPHHSEPKMLDLGRAMSAESLAALHEIVLAASRGLHIPTQYLVSGEASANHWNDAELRRALHERSVYPELTANNEFWTDTALRPILALSRAGGLVLGDGDPADYRLGCDTTVLDVKSDSLQTWALAHQTGVASRSWLASKLGVPESELLELPSNVNDWERWLYSKASAARAGAHVVEDFPGQLPGGLAPSPTSEDGADLPGLPAETAETAETAEVTAAAALDLIISAGE